MTSKLVSGKQAVHHRNYRRARDKALVRLAHLYPDQYKQLLSEQRSADELEGKTWFIDADSQLTIGVHTRANGVPAPVSTGEGFNESNNEGEA